MTISLSLNCWSSSPSSQATMFFIRHVFRLKHIDFPWFGSMIANMFFGEYRHWNNKFGTKSMGLPENITFPIPMDYHDFPNLICYFWGVPHFQTPIISTCYTDLFVVWYLYLQLYCFFMFFYFGDSMFTFWYLIFIPYPQYCCFIPSFPYVCLLQCGAPYLQVGL